MRRKTGRPKLSSVEAFIIDQPVPAHRLHTRGAARVMKDTRVDPDDVRPNAARAPRQVTGYRNFCILRRMILSSPGGPITTEHVHAGDKLRELVDVAQIGRSAGMVALNVHLPSGPSMGPGVSALTQAQASRQVSRALTQFKLPEQMLLVAVVLQNQSLASFCRAHPPPGMLQLDPRGMKIVLVDVLTRLAEHFSTEIDHELARGQRLALT
jgi:hypothetical protein